MPGDFQKLDEGHFEGIKTLYESFDSHYWHSTTLLAQGLAFYLAISAAFLGYVLNPERDLGASALRLLAVGSTIVSSLFLVAFVLWAWGLLTLVKLLERFAQEIEPGVFNRMGLATLYARWRLVKLVVAIIVPALIITVVAGMLLVSSGSVSLR